MSFACRNEKGVHDLYQQNVSLLVKAENKFDMDTNTMSYGINIIWTTKGATVHFRDLKELTRKHTFRNTFSRIFLMQQILMQQNFFNAAEFLSYM